MATEPWLAIAIGNSRVRAAIFSEGKLAAEFAFVPANLDLLEAALSGYALQRVAIASVVPDLRTPWHDRPDTRLIVTADIPLGGLYPQLGVDRALAAWGAGQTYGYPILVIDAGTAIALTAVNGEQQFVGGAILPGLRLQLQSLYRGTAGLPQVELPDRLPEGLPDLWAGDTVGAMHSGIMYTAIAGLRDFIDDWQARYHGSQVVLTGGDGDRLQPFLQIPYDASLIFWGMQAWHGFQYEE